jgi:hypothetical protein
MPQEKCPYCGGSEIIANIEIKKTAESGDIGLSFKPGIIFLSVEPFLADLCKGCGTITRLHVKNTDQKWITDEP